MPIYFDTETCGFHGVCVLIQWAKGDGEISLHSVWTTPIYETLDLIETLSNNPGGVIGFNLVFDWFHINKIYNLLAKYHDYNAYPVDIIDELAELEPSARDGLCLKPVKALDLMLHARKGPYQSTMDRGNVKITKIPTTMAYKLADELEKRIKLRDIHFARNKDNRRWHVMRIKDKDTGEYEDKFMDVVLKFNPSTALKALSVDIGLVSEDDVKFISDTGVPDYFKPVEYGYAPFAKAGIWNKNLKKVIPTGTGKWRGTWPQVVREHITHWAYNEIGREYAYKDVVYTRGLHHHFLKDTKLPCIMNDDDSVLACMVGAVRWKGFRVDIPKMKALRVNAIKRAEKYPFRNSPQKVLYFIKEFMDPMEAVAITNTKKLTLETISNWENDDGIHPAALRAKEIIDARSASKEVELYDKILHAGRFHASFKVIGALSSRMSGADKLNAQGIKRTTEVRECFLFADEDENMEGGDFDAFEVALADAEYDDPVLHEALQNGKKFHALFGIEVFTDMTYDEILASKNKENDKYTKSKNAVFAMFYGGEPFTLKTRLGVDMETAEKAYKSITNRYKGIGKARTNVSNMFNTLKQKGGIGSEITWSDPADYIESMLGFKRYFTLENMICKSIFELAQNPPQEWQNIQGVVIRTDREQTISGSVQSALFGAAFRMQASNARAALNHRMQSTGAQITKHLERNIWDLQPSGVKQWIIRPFNVHDEILTANKKELSEKIKQVVYETVEEYRDLVPLIRMEWKNNLKTWADK